VDAHEGFVEDVDVVDEMPCLQTLGSGNEAVLFRKDAMDDCRNKEVGAVDKPIRPAPRSRQDGESVDQPESLRQFLFESLERPLSVPVLPL
jgi:hypothetical protein